MSLSLPAFPNLDQAVPNPAAVIREGSARITLLTPGFIRLEYSPSQSFEDRPSQVFWQRRLPPPPFTHRARQGAVEIETGALRILYREAPGGFTPDSLQIEVKSLGTVYHFGDDDPANLRGTARTLDRSRGPVPLEPGLLSRSGWAVVDDTASLLFTPEGWLEPRKAEPGYRDLYFLGTGHDYTQALVDFQKVSGAAPLLPRWALGNWWSRFWAYRQTELQQLIEDFNAHDIPLSVCILDMDWHLTTTGNACTGWTGYTWNRELFPNPPAFLAWLHAHGLKTALNLHPAEGVHPHEAAYPEMARALGADPESREPLAFDIASPTYARAYFEYLHHPREREGVDFWWLDWQQGHTTPLPGLDPLWWLNHLHAADRARDGRRRPFIFSRWGGLGNQRYPIGFSGDTEVAWESLSFQPYFTAVAANVAYGWWSHDIGGHFHGMEDGELFTRWVQFGVFSPILRLHSAKDLYIDRRPWAFDTATLEDARRAMQLRQALVPYLYTMAWRNESEGLALARPLYHDYPEAGSAYLAAQQYLFGSELLAAPVTSPLDPELGHSRQAVWLPEGSWFDFFTGEAYRGGGWTIRYARRDEIPVYARAGAIVPMDARPVRGAVGNPEALRIAIFPGASHRFNLYEDDGETQAYRQGSFRETPMAWEWGEQAATFRVLPVEGDRSLGPERRSFELVFYALTRPSQVQATAGGRPRVVPVEDGEFLHPAGEGGRDRRGITAQYDASRNVLTVRVRRVEAGEGLTVTLRAAGDSLCLSEDAYPRRVRRFLRSGRIPTAVKSRLESDLPILLEDIHGLAKYGALLSDRQMQALAETLTGAGVYRLPAYTPQGEGIVLFNPRRLPDFRFWLSGLPREWDRTVTILPTTAPEETVIRPEKDEVGDESAGWKLRVDYFGLMMVDV